MGRKKNAVETVELHISIPIDLAARFRALLWSQVDQRIPQGAMTGVISALVRDWCDRHPASGGDSRPLNPPSGA